MRTSTTPTTSTGSSLTADYGRPPAYSHLVPYVSTAGPKVAKVCAASGYAPDPEQQLILDQAFGLDEEGLPAASLVVIIAPRQNLKSGVLKQLSIGWLFVAKERSVTWTAHNFDTALDAFEDPFQTGMAQIVENTPMLARRVRSVGRSHGSEGFVLGSGAKFRLRTRTADGGRGLASDKVILDEGFALQDVHISALRPTMLARPRSQLVVASSACLRNSDVLREMVARGRAGEDRMAYFEWCDPRPNEGCAAEDCDHAKTAQGCALDDIGRLAAANPAFGRRISERALRDARRDMSPAKFAVEVMGWHEEPGKATSDLTVEVWQTAVTDDTPTGRMVMAVDTGPAHAWSSIVVCGGGVLELVDRRRGSSWLPDRVRELCDRHQIAEVVIDPAGPVAGVIPDFEAAGVRLRLLSGADSAAACGALVDSIGEQRVKVRHADAFLSAVAGASRRKSGDRWKWSRVSSEVDISPLVAATWAAWAWSDQQTTNYDVLESAY